jgi:hypothetical protein
MKKQKIYQMVIQASRYAFEMMLNGDSDPQIWFKMHQDFKAIKENAVRAL